VYESALSFVAQTQLLSKIRNHLSKIKNQSRKHTLHLQHKFLNQRKMKSNFRRVVSTLLFASLIFSVCRAQNPVVQTHFTPDPAPMLYNDTVFLYTGHDEDASTYFTMNDWQIFSSTDMVNWTDRGRPMSYQTFKWANGQAWAGQCVERNGKFY
jgi:hypothetical protein